MDALAKHGVPASQRANFVKVLERMLLREQDEEQLSPEAAFLALGVRILGYDSSEGFLTDGPKDYGFDFLDISSDSCTIFQSKSMNYSGGIDVGFQISPSYLDDVRQIKEVLNNLDNIPADCNKPVGRALLALKNQISRQALQKISEKDPSEIPPFSITIMLLALGEKFTPQAETEFNLLETTKFQYGGVNLQITVVPIFIDDLLEEIWSQRNDDWKDRTGTKKDKITLHVVGDVIKDAKTAIFYAKAYDFVEAFDSLGYQFLNRTYVRKFEARRSTRQFATPFQHVLDGEISDT